MKKNNNCKKIIICFILSITISFFIEVFGFNYNSIFYKSYNEKAVISKIENSKLENNCFNVDNDYTKLDIKTNKDYINKISFDYKTKNGFTYVINAKNYQRLYHSSELFDKAVKKVKTTSKDLQLTFYGNDIKICNVRLSNEFLINEYRLIIISLLSLLVLISFFFKDFFINNLSVFSFVSGLLIGISIIIVTPVCLNTSADDEVHFKNSYLLLENDEARWSLSENYFDFMVIGNALKFKTYEEIKMYNNYLNNNFNKENTIIRINSTRLTYNKIVYIPLSLGLKISKIFHMKFTHMIYFSKLLNLLFYLIILFFALKIATKYKKIMFYIGMLPTNLYLASQFSYDPTITAGLLLAFASFMKINDEEKINKKYIIIFVLSIVWASLIKVFYVPIILLLLTIKKEKFDNSRQCKIFKFSIVLLTLVVLSNLVFPVLLNEVTGDTRIAGTNVMLQIKYILSNPFRYAYLLLDMTINNFHKLFFGYRALNELGYLITFDGLYIKIIYYINLVGLILTIITNNEVNKLDKKQKAISILMVFIIWILICTALYLDWNPVGSNSIEGVNARYFLPLLIYFITPFTFYNKKIEKFVKKYNIFIYIILLVNFLNLVYLLVSYYS